MNKTSSKRIEYIDALRGFTMILVVCHHVTFSCIPLEDVPNFHIFLEQIRMPMFFFISGFVIYKAGIVWSFKHVGVFLKKKFLIQILATAFFFFIYAYYTDLDLWQAFLARGKGGYWFTYVLFIFYVFYSVLRLSFRKHEDIAALLIAICFYSLSSSTGYETIPLSNDFKGILCISHWRYFTFFLIGTLVKKHFEVVQKALDGKVLFLVSVLLFFLLNIFAERMSKTGLAFWTICLVKTLSGMVLLFGFFRANQEHFQKKKVLGQALQYIGRRTLDVYFLHYFLLPKNLGQVITVFHDYPMPLLEFVFTMLVGLIIVAFSLLIGNVIRLSPILAHSLFGAPKESASFLPKEFVHK